MAPTYEWRRGPGKGVDPGQGNAQRDLTVVGGVRLSGDHHGAVALIGEDSQGNEGHDTCSNKDRGHKYIGNHYTSSIKKQH